ncbi:hypothetical protein [Actinomadura madurae]|uniref:hypothetical protein n=1 Tax=Actinomadura madurae TaxID=1993 RepID=UPI0020D22960|nr:hypothetical protein [Actinomadura madurae]MCP9976816.1 hypothetical protein [Actinomadura madurae]
MPYDARERMIQDAMALRSLGDLARDLQEVLEAVGHWAARLRRRAVGGRAARSPPLRAAGPAALPGRPAGGLARPPWPTSSGIWTG